MDTDSNDGTSPETLNGETKPDAAKLAQTAIIKQVGVFLMRTFSILFLCLPLPVSLSRGNRKTSCFHAGT